MKSKSARSAGGIACTSTERRPDSRYSKTSEVVQTGTAWEDVVKNVSGSPIVTLHATFHCLTTNGLRITDENVAATTLSFSSAAIRN